MNIGELNQEAYDWHISDKQRSLIIDKSSTLSKKEASLIIKIMQAMIDDRPVSQDLRT